LNDVEKKNHGIVSCSDGIPRSMLLVEWRIVRGNCHFHMPSPGFVCHRQEKQRDFSVAFSVAMVRVKIWTKKFPNVKIFS
jgi:hypothetical protein